MIKWLPFCNTLLVLALCTGCMLPVWPPMATPTPRSADIPIEMPDPASMQEAYVFEVVDGDTVKVLIDGRRYTLRYIGVDTPETVHPNRPVEWMGPEASAANKKLVEDQWVYLERDISETDRYGRLLRYVWLPDGTLVNAELVARGYAQVSTFPPDVRYDGIFLALEREARRQGLGLWADEAGDGETADVRIETIVYDGEINPAEPDEYCQILNAGEAPVNLEGWRLNAGQEGQDFIFPDYVLGPGVACRVYTNQVHRRWGGFSFESNRAIWLNSGDCGYLYDASGDQVSEYCY